MAIDGYLEDYAFLGRGALTLFEATGNVEHLAFAMDLGQAITEAFWDDDEARSFSRRPAANHWSRGRRN